MFKGWEQQTWKALLIVTKTNYPLPPPFFLIFKTKTLYSCFVLFEPKLAEI